MTSFTSSCHLFIVWGPKSYKPKSLASPLKVPQNNCQLIRNITTSLLDWLNGQNTSCHFPVCLKVLNKATLRQHLEQKLWMNETLKFLYQLKPEGHRKGSDAQLSVWEHKSGLLGEVFSSNHSNLRWLKMLDIRIFEESIDGQQLLYSSYGDICHVYMWDTLYICTVWIRFE